MPSSQGQADLHLHSCHDGWGDGNDTVEAIFEFVENHTTLDLIAITDHDSVDGARAGQELHARETFRFGFVPGVEVTTTSGHLLCYFMGEIVAIPSLRSLAWTVRFARDHDAMCVLAHPVYPPWLRRAAMDPDSRAVRSVDAVEVINGGLGRGAQARLDMVGDALQGHSPTVGNSDAHHKEAIGSVFTSFPGRSLDDFAAALRDRSTAAVRRAHVPMPRHKRSFTRRRSMTKPGWVRNVYREVVGEPSA